MLLSFKYWTMLWKELNRNKPSLLYILLIVLTYVIYYILLKKYACM